jgi:hypothetical protein
MHQKLSGIDNFWWRFLVDNIASYFARKNATPLPGLSSLRTLQSCLQEIATKNYPNRMIFGAFKSAWNAL